MKIGKGITLFKYRMDLRNNLQKSTYDLLKITYEETKRELERRSKNK